MWIKFRNPAVYGGVHYSSGDVAEVDENYGKYTVGMKNAEEAAAPSPPPEELKDIGSPPEVEVKSVKKGK